MRPVWLVVAATLPLLFLSPRIARAQGPSAEGGSAPRAEVPSEAPRAEAERQQLDTPLLPVLLWSPTVPYPPGGIGSAQVTLRILVDETGRVVDAQVVDGAAPFSAPALTFAREFRFAPARVGGQARAAHLLLAIDFEPPGVGAGPAPGSADAGPSAAGPRQQPIDSASSPSPVEQEVAVSGVRRSAAERVVSDAETRIIPGAEGDPVRAIESLPGTVPVLASGPFLGLRGAASGMVGYEYDGIAVPYLFHLARGPAVVHPWLVESATVHATGGAARLGRSGGGFFEATAAEPSGRPRAHARVRATDAAVGVEVPLANGRANALLAGRYSYTKPLVSLVAPEFSLDYWDYQARFRFALSDADQLELLTFGAGDRSAQQVEGGQFEDLFHGSFHRVALRYARTSEDGSRFRLTAHAGHDRWDGNASPYRPHANVFGLRGEETLRLAPRAQVAFGADLLARFQVDQYEAPQTLPDQPGPIETFERTDLAAGTWVDVVATPSDRLTVAVGLRLETASSTETPATPGQGAFSLQPRASLSYQLAPNVRLHESVGVAAQPRSPSQRPPGRVHSVAGGLEHTCLSDVGVEFLLPGAVSLDFTLFQNVYFNVGDVQTLGYLEGQPAELDRGLGHAMGLGVSLRRTLVGPLRGFISYTLSQSLRSVGLVTSFSQYDRPHVLDGELAYDFGRGYGISSRGIYYSGYPARLATVAQTESPVPRATDYYQVDVQLEKRWQLGGSGGFIALTLGILNATLNQESNDFVCSESACQEQLVGPATIPTLGLEGEL